MKSETELREAIKNLEALIEKLGYVKSNTQEYELFLAYTNRKNSLLWVLSNEQPERFIAPSKTTLTRFIDPYMIDAATYEESIVTDMNHLQDKLVSAMGIPSTALKDDRDRDKA
jgi:hypothetical protein